MHFCVHIDALSLLNWIISSRITSSSFHWVNNSLQQSPIHLLPFKKICPPFHKIPSGALYFFKELDEIFKLMDSLQEFHPDLGLLACIFYTQGRNESSRTHCSAFSCHFVKMIGSNVNYSHGNTVCSTYNMLKRKHLPNIAFPQLTTWESNFITCWMSRIPPFWKFLVLLAEV